MPRLSLLTWPMNEPKAALMLPLAFSTPSLKKPRMQLLLRYRKAVAPFWPNRRMRLMVDTAGVLAAAVVDALAPAAVAGAVTVSCAKPVLENRREARSRVLCMVI